MNLKLKAAYKLKGERNIRPRKPLVFGSQLFVIFVYDKKGFIQSKVQSLDANDFTLQWEFIYDHVINNIVISTSGDLICSCMGGQIKCLCIKDGTLLWEFKVNESNIGPISDDVGRTAVFSAIQGGKSTWCIDTNKGTLLWKVSNTGHAYHPLIIDDSVYNCIGNNIYCLYLNSGLSCWTSTEPKTYLFNPKRFNRFVIATGHGLVNLYEADSGMLRASIETGAASSIREVICEEKNIYFGDEKGFFYAYHFNDKEVNFTLRWKLETKGGIESMPALKNSLIYVINNACTLLAIDKGTGKIMYHTKIKGEAHISGITMVDSDIYFSCKGGFVFKFSIEA